MPSLASRDSVGVSISPPKVLGCPNPASSSMTMRILGASSGRWRGCSRHLWTDSCIVGPTLPPIGGDGNGSTSWAGRRTLPTRSSAMIPIIVTVGWSFHLLSFLLKCRRCCLAFREVL